MAVRPDLEQLPNEVSTTAEAEERFARQRESFRHLADLVGAALSKAWAKTDKQGSRGGADS
jgi:hypothetical protein